MRGSLRKLLKSDVAVEFTLSIRNLICNASLRAYLPCVMNRDRQALPQGHLDQEIDYPDFGLALVRLFSVRSLKLLL